MIELEKFEYSIKKIKSSIVNQLQYSKEEEVLRVQFSNGTWYQYYGVCYSTFHDLVGFTLGESFSKYFNELIKYNKSYKYEKEQ